MRLLAKLAQRRVRIALPNEFVARMVLVALLILYATGAGLVWHGVHERADYLSNPKSQVKLAFVLLLTLNAFVLHRLTFPRLARGRRVTKWRPLDWLGVGVPVGLSNFLWLFVALLGVARPSNYSMLIRDLLEIAVGCYLVAQAVVFVVLALASQDLAAVESRIGMLKRVLASLGELGSRDVSQMDGASKASRSGRSSKTCRRGDFASCGRRQPIRGRHCVSSAQRRFAMVWSAQRVTAQSGLDNEDAGTPG